MDCTYVVTDTWERFLRVAASLCRWELAAPAEVLEHLLFGGETVEPALLTTLLNEVARGEAALDQSGANGWLLLLGATPRRVLTLFDGEVLWRSGASSVRADSTGAKFFLDETEVDATTFQAQIGIVVRKTGTAAVFAPTLGVLRAVVVLACENEVPLRFLRATSVAR